MSLSIFPTQMCCLNWKYNRKSTLERKPGSFECYNGTLSNFFFFLTKHNHRQNYKMEKQIAIIRALFLIIFSMPHCISAVACETPCTLTHSIRKTRWNGNCAGIFLWETPQSNCVRVYVKGVFRNEDDFNEAWQTASVGMLAAPEGDPQVQMLILPASQCVFGGISNFVV